MNQKSRLLAIGLGFLAAVACSSGDDDPGGNAGTGPAAGIWGGAAGGIAGAMAGTGGGVFAGSGGSVFAGAGGATGGSIAAGTGGGGGAGTGGVQAGNGGMQAGTGGVQAGTGGVQAGVGGVQAGAGGAQAGTGGSTGYVPPCIQNGSQVVAIGDSYMTMYPDTLVVPRIEALAQADGALEAGQTYRDVSVPGTSMGTGEIPSQFTNAVAADPDIKLVIMTGGGNDVLIGARQCLEAGSASNPECQAVVQNAIDTARGLYDEMVATGVSDAIYFYYPHIIPSGLLTGTAPNEILDYSYPLAQAECEDAVNRYNGAIRCYFIDLRPVFGDTYQYINALDAIHPTAAGADLIAQQVYQVMKDNCLGQPESKGCCAP